MRTAKMKNPQNLFLLDGGSENKFHILFNQAFDSIFTFDSNHKFDEVNCAFENLTGHLRTEIIGKDISILFPDENRDVISKNSKKLSLDLLNTEGKFEEVSILQKDKNVKLVEINVRKIQSGKKSLALVLIRDTSDKHHLEREVITKHAELKNAFIELEKVNAELSAMQATLVQAGKMAALGELTAGIAHELNQPLQGIRGYAQELKSTLKEEGSSKEFLEEIIKNSDKMTAIISYLRDFTRKSTENFDWIDIAQPINEALKMLSKQLELRGIKVKFTADPSLPKVYVNPLQLEQVFINLTTNARDAIEATKRGFGEISIHAQSEGGFLNISFADNGIGMSPSLKNKIFNPFFTTKEVGQGMGLGLSISYGILNKIHATVTVESQPDAGTKFFIKIPKDYRELN